MKIDKFFVINMGVNDENYEIICVIVILVYSLGLDVVVEGIEIEK